MAEKLLDYQEALDRLGGDEEFLNELLAELVEQFDYNIENIKKAVSSNNYEDLKQLSHSLKGASANLNVTRMAEHFKELESMGTKQHIAGAEKLLDLVVKDRNELDLFINNN